MNERIETPPLPSARDELRQRIAQQTAEFLKHGGHIRVVTDYSPENEIAFILSRNDIPDSSKNKMIKKLRKRSKGLN